MSINLTNISLVMIFVLLALKWIVTGYFGSISGQLIFVLPIFLFLYLSIITLSFNKSLRGTVSFGSLTQGQEKRLPVLMFLRAGRLQTVLLILYLIIISLGLLRSTGTIDQLSLLVVSGRIFTLITIAMFCYLVFRTYAYKGQLDRVWTLVTYGLCIYVFMNIVGSVIGIRNPFVENTQLIRDDVLFAFMKYRSSFPFSANHNSFAFEAGVLGVLAFVRMYHPKYSYKRFDVIILLIAIGAIIMANSRTPLVGIITIVLACIILKRRKLWLLFPMFGMVIIVPLFITHIDISSWLDALPIDISFFSRTHDIAMIAKLNNRDLYWRPVLEEFLSPKLIHIIGYGAYGHIASGVDYGFSKFWQNSDIISTHNSFLQHLLDFGYVGLLLLILMIVNIMVVFSHHRYNYEIKNDHVLSPALAVTIYFVVCSCTSNILSFYEPMTFFIFMLINACVIWHGTSRTQC